MLSLQAQHGDNWAFGLHSGIKFTKDGIVKIKTKIEYDTNQTTYTHTRISVAYSDCQSNLVAYGNQVQLWNQHDFTIQNSHYRLGGGYFFLYYYYLSPIPIDFCIILNIIFLMSLLQTTIPFIVMWWIWMQIMGMVRLLKK